MTTRVPPTRREDADRRRSRRLVLLGLTLLAAGVAVLGYLGWQLIGSTWVSRAAHERIISDLEATWSRGGAATATTPDGTVTAIVRIPRLGDQWEVPLMRGTDDDALASGLGHFSDSADPGDIGNFAVAGHRVTHGEPLREMPALRPGDTVVVETSSTIYTYRLDTGGDDLNVPFTETWVVDPTPRNPDPAEPGPDPDARRLLTLTTCAELFRTEDRLVAFGHLVGTRPR